MTQSTIDRIAYLSLRIFLSCMFLCAALFLYAIWSQPEPAETTMKFVVTVFVVGLASFLTWITTVIQKISTT